MPNYEHTNIDSKFRFILLAAGRAEQVMRGARPKIEYSSPKLARGAMEEVLGGLIEWDHGPAPVVEEEAVEGEGAEELAEE